MSDMVTHWAVFDDCRRLLSADTSIEPVFAQVADSEREIARLGAITRGGGKWMQPVLELARDTWSDPDAHPAIDRRLAFVVGWITHQACDTVVKPLLSRHAGSEWNLAHDVLQRQPRARGREHEVDTDHVQQVSAYYDVHVFRKVYLSGEEEPFSSLFLGTNGTRPGKALEEFLGSAFQRALLSCHTLIPPQSRNLDDLVKWQDAVFGYMQPLYLQTHWWIDAFQNPDPAKHAQFEVETKFYRDDDPAIAAARAIHRGERLTSHEVQEATADDVNQSIYGQALELSMRYLRAATAYWRHMADSLVAPNAYKPAWQMEAR